MARHSSAARPLDTLGRKLDDAAIFLRTWAKKPLLTGSITPSSIVLSRRIASFVDPAVPGPIVEIGPGTGPTTEALLRHGIPEERLVLVEFYPAFCALLREKFGKARVVEGDAFALKATLEGVLEEKAGAIVCGLPLLTKPEAARLDLLAQAFDLLAPGAPFTITVRVKAKTSAAAQRIPLRQQFRAEVDSIIPLDREAEQRLARRICPECKAPVKVEARVLLDFGFTDEQVARGGLMKGTGCKNCNGSGYRGRVALYEVMVLSDPVKDLVLQGASTAELKTEAIRLGMATLRRSGLNKINEGMTTLEEILRVTASD